MFQSTVIPRGSGSNENTIDLLRDPNKYNCIVTLPTALTSVTLPQHLLCTHLPSSHVPATENQPIMSFTSINGDNMDLPFAKESFNPSGMTMIPVSPKSKVKEEEDEVSLPLLVPGI